MKRILLTCLAVLAGFALATAGSAQSLQTGALLGTVTSNDGQPLPGVTVTATSPALIGERTAISAVNGDYVVKGLPPGQYTVKFSLEGMQSIERSITVPLGGSARADATMEVAAAEETIVVTGEAPSALETKTIVSNFTGKEIDALPLPNRTPFDVAELAGNLTDNGTVAGQVTIGGAFAYDNAFLIDGVDFQDRYFGTADNIYVEDAIEETQVLTGGAISSEFGRFSGGVINSVTKSGGNQFTGSFRIDFSNSSWTNETPYQKARNQQNPDKTLETYSATLGGPILKDRLWFFLSGRDRSVDNERVLAVSGQQVTQGIKEPRYQGKLTLNLASNHTIQGTYTTREEKRTKEIQISPIDINAVSDNSKRNNEATSISYQGVFTNSLFGEARWAEKDFSFKGLGGTDTNPGSGSPFLTNNDSGIGCSGCAYNAPYFDATDPEQRNNETWYGALSWFKSTQRGGSHDVKFGGEYFNDIGIGGNSQSPTGWVVYSDPLHQNPDGTFIPAFHNLFGDSGLLTFAVFWDPTRGAKSEIKTTSFFVNDVWTLNANWSFNLGVRYEDYSSKQATGLTIGSDSIVPRLGVTFDPKGDGSWKFDVTYSEFAGRATANQFGAGSSAGNPAYAVIYYIGPDGEGRDFAPGFDLNNYLFGYAGSPAQTVTVDKNLKSPLTREYTASIRHALPKGGYMTLSYTNRKLMRVVENFINTHTGLAEHFEVGPFSGGPIEMAVIKNSSYPTREFESIVLMGQYSILNNWTLGGNWTWQLKNEGNFEGEVGQSPQGYSIYGDYPELYDLKRNYPWGKNDDYQKHKVRLWSSYQLDLGRGGMFDFGGVFRYDTGTAYSFIARSQPFTAIQNSRDPGYIGRPYSQDYYFGSRGAATFNSAWSLDLSVGYEIPIWKTLAPYVKFVMTNVTNEDKLVTYSTSVRPDPNSPLDANGLPTGYIRQSSFGKATASTNYQNPRAYSISAGIRF